MNNDTRQRACGFIRWAGRIGVVLAFAGLTLTFVTIVLPGKAQASRFVFGNESPYDTMDPHVTFDVGRVAVRINLYDSLYRWEDNPPKLIPWLAESYKVSSDGLKYTYKLRQGAKFHDGSEVTANDVVYSLERILALKKGAAALFSTVIEPGHTKAADRYTVEFTLIRPSAIFLSIVPEILVVNSPLLKKHEQGGDWGAAWLTSNDAGSGSYVLDRFDPAVGFSAKRFQDHFLGWHDKYFDEIEFRGVLEGNTRVLGLIKGDFQGVGGYLPEDQTKRLKDSGKVNILEQESMRVMLFQINNQRPPLDDVHVRRAISHAFDYNGFNNDILGGTVSRNPGPIPNNMWGAVPNLRGYDYNIDQAKKELQAAKQKLDRPLEVAFLTGFSQTEQAATVMQNGLRKAGIESKLVNNPWPVIVDKMRKVETSPDLVVYWISTYYADPNNWIGEMYNSAGWGTFKSSSFYKNPKVDSLLDAALASTNQAVREKAYQEAEKIVVDDAASIWIYNTKWFGPYSKDVEGIRFCPIGNGQEMRWAYLK